MKTVPEDVLDLLHTVMHEYRSLQYRFLRDGPFEITHMDGRVLGFFAANPGATQKELAKHSGRDQAQLARLIKRLREEGLLSANADASDRRNVRLSLTERGQEIESALRQQAKRLSKKAVSGLSADELQQLGALLSTVRDNLAAEE
ncbi:MarR family transcriptional regulator [Caballeronia novacaledonica]|uniref:MarR family transcriptional regulator n=1 Tax=Caballeronia novacaledonica TaxID=1544861 RepID=A0A2U3ID87_9BURK|nr:MarR family transcriptional regulator [Caballeronia novacaledonica]SPB18186.1 MarR family transcriptional regulator [Caballeronia novacaledonica]